MRPEACWHSRRARAREVKELTNGFVNTGREIRRWRTRLKFHVPPPPPLLAPRARGEMAQEGKAGEGAEGWTISLRCNPRSSLPGPQVKPLFRFAIRKANQKSGCIYPHGLHVRAELALSARAVNENSVPAELRDTSDSPGISESNPTPVPTDFLLFFPRSRRLQLKSFN